MSDGGLLPWRVQRIRQPVGGLLGTCGYADLAGSLPDPPKGQTWFRDPSSREWRLVPLATAGAADEGEEGQSGAAAMASVRPEGGDGAGELELAGTTPSAEAVVAVASPVAAAVPLDPDGEESSGTRRHRVLPTDTFQGLCLRYRVTPTELRRANGMAMGTSLALIEELVIPSNDRNRSLGANGLGPTKEEKVASLVSKALLMSRGKCKLSYTEARAYLEIAEWNVQQAVEDAKGDFVAESR